nr:two pore domain potassium channel family protein [Actinomycetota bacterium]
MDFADVVVSVIGAGLILLMAADVFHTLLYPHGTGPVCRLIMRALWLLSRRFAGRASTVAAPAAMAAVIGAWASLSIMGWALVYLPHLPDGFVYAEGVRHGGD